MFWQEFMSNLVFGTAFDCTTRCLEVGSQWLDDSEAGAAHAHRLAPYTTLENIFRFGQLLSRRLVQPFNVTQSHCPYEHSLYLLSGLAHVAS